MRAIARLGWGWALSDHPRIQKGGMALQAYGPRSNLTPTPFALAKPSIHVN